MRVDAATIIVGVTGWLTRYRPRWAGSFQRGNVTKKGPPEEAIAKMLEQRDAAYKEAKAVEEAHLDEERDLRWDKYQTANRILKQ